MPSLTHHSRWLTWFKLIAVTGFAQVIVQAIGIVSGLLIIRLLPTHEYALYTLAYTMLNTMMLLADAGIASGVMSQGGKVWQDKQRLGSVLITGMQLRKKFAVFSVLLAFPILFYLLGKHNSDGLMSFLIALALIPVFFTGLSGTLLEIAPKLHQAIKPLQKIQIAASATRLILLCLALLYYPFAYVAIACTGGVQLGSNWFLRKISRRYADYQQQLNKEVHKKILDLVKRTLPSSLFFCISSQVPLWLISIFGSTTAVAQLGALGRLVTVLNLINVILSTLVIPRYARLPADRKRLLSRFLQIQVGLLIINVCVVTLVWLFPNHVLWVLGKDYIGLTDEVVLMAVVGVMALMSATTYQLSVSRGVVINPVLSITILLAVQVSAALALDVSTVMGVLKYSIFFFLAEYLVRITFYIRYLFNKFDNGIKTAC